MFKGLLEDRILIRERYNTYSDAVFKNDVESWLANYTDNGVWEIANEKHQGKGALREKWELLWAGIDSMAFFTEIGSIEVEFIEGYNTEFVTHINDESEKVSMVSFELVAGGSLNIICSGLAEII